MKKEKIMMAYEEVFIIASVSGWSVIRLVFFWLKYYSIQCATYSKRMNMVGMHLITQNVDKNGERSNNSRVYQR